MSEVKRARIGTYVKFEVVFDESTSNIVYGQIIGVDTETKKVLVKSSLGKTFSVSKEDLQKISEEEYEENAPRKKAYLPPYEVMKSRMVERPEQKTVSGRPIMDVGDSVAEFIGGEDEGSICELLKQLYFKTVNPPVIDEAESLRPQLEVAGFDDPEALYANKYQKLNPGMQRMNIGNRLRGCLSRAKIGESRAKQIFWETKKI